MQRENRRLRFCAVFSNKELGDCVPATQITRYGEGNVKANVTTELVELKEAIDAIDDL